MIKLDAYLKWESDRRAGGEFDQGAPRVSLVKQFDRPHVVKWREVETGEIFWNRVDCVDLAECMAQVVRDMDEFELMAAYTI